MDDCLILLTNYYPYYKGEEYLESEIKYLAKRYKQIYIFSTMVSRGMKQTRSIPDNVIAIPSEIEHSIVGKIKMVCRQIRIINKDTQKKQMIRLDSKRNILHRMYCYYFESRALDIYEELIKKIEHINFNEFNCITIYSYWLYVTARLSLEFKNKYFKDRPVYTFSRAHRYDLYEYAAPLKYLPQRKFLIENLDDIYPCSQDGVENLNNTYPDYKEKISVRRLGTNSDKILAQISNKKLYITSCSVIRKVKRLDLLIEVLNILEKSQIEYLWTHIGEGPEYKNIRKLAEKKLDKNNVNFLGRLKNSEVIEWYKNNISTVFINLSSSEGVPVSIMEAISKGLPVIATDVGGTREILNHGENGYLLNKNVTPNEVAEYLIGLVNMNTSDYLSMSKRSLEIWNERCNANQLYSEFVEEIIEKSRGMN